PDLLPVAARADDDSAELADLAMTLDGDGRCQPRACRDELGTFGRGHQPRGIVLQADDAVSSPFESKAPQGQGFPSSEGRRRAACSQKPNMLDRRPGRVPPSEGCRASASNQ